MTSTQTLLASLEELDPAEEEKFSEVSFERVTDDRDLAIELKLHPSEFPSNFKKTQGYLFVWFPLSQLRSDGKRLYAANWLLEQKGLR